MSFSFRKDNSTDVIGLDLNGDYIRIVHAKEVQGKIKIKEIRAAQLPAGDESKIVSFIATFVKQLKSSSKKVIALAPSNLFISKNVDIPSKDTTEISKIIDLQSGRFTPYSREEIVLDWFAMETPEQHYTNVLLIIMQRKVIERYYAILEASGLEIDQIALTSEAFSVIYDSGSGTFSAEGVEASAGIFVNSESSDFTIVDNHQMVFVRSIPIGVRQLEADAENAYKVFMDELNKSINSYKDQGFGRQIKNLYLSGILKEFDFLEKNIRDQVPFIALNNVTIKAIHENTFFGLDESVKQQIAKYDQTSFFDLIAAVMNYPRLKVDLIPSEIKMKHQVRKGGREIITLGILIMTMFMMLSVFMVVKIFLKKEQIKKLDQINETSFGTARSLEAISTKSKVLKKLIKTRGKGLYVFEKINSMIGEDIYLTSFGYDKDGGVSFGGTAESMSRVFAFVNELEESNYFKDVKTKETKSRREGQKEVADFQIECIMTEGL